MDGFKSLRVVNLNQFLDLVGDLDVNLRVNSELSLDDKSKDISDQVFEVAVEI